MNASSREKFSAGSVIYNHVGKGTVGSVEFFIFYFLFFVFLVIRVCLRIENEFTEVH